MCKRKKEQCDLQCQRWVFKVAIEMKSDHGKPSFYPDLWHFVPCNPLNSQAKGKRQCLVHMLDSHVKITDGIGETKYTALPESEWNPPDVSMSTA